MSRARRRSHHGRFEIVGRGFPSCRQGQRASARLLDDRLPVAYIDGALMAPAMRRSKPTEPIIAMVLLRRSPDHVMRGVARPVQRQLQLFGISTVSTT